MIKRYQVYALVGEDTEILIETDTPVKAIECFFSNQKEYPTCVAIIADRYYDAQLLIDLIHSRDDILSECYEKYDHIPYKYSYIKEEIDKAYDTRKYEPENCMGFFMDQVHPFSLG